MCKVLHQDLNNTSSYRWPTNGFRTFVQRSGCVILCWGSNGLSGFQPHAATTFLLNRCPPGYQSITDRKCGQYSMLPLRHGSRMDSFIQHSHKEQAVRDIESSETLPLRLQQLFTKISKGKDNQRGHERAL